MFKALRHLTKVEKIVVSFLTVILFLSGYRVVQAFYAEHSELFPAEGGTYIEGAVGKIGPLNPLFVQRGSVTADISQLIFSGLTQYDPKTQEIVPDLADFKIASDSKEYTFVIKEGARWHDDTPVTSNDVLFTYETVIKNPEFKGAILNYNDYRGVRLAKIDERTLTFFLEKPDSFFLVKTMTGILPHHLLEAVPISLLAEAPFNLDPIGSGQYRLVSTLSSNNHVELSLEAFDDFYDKKPSIENLLIKIFPDEEELMTHLAELDGIRAVTKALADKIRKKSKWVVHRYHLPQYVAVFINNESPLLKNKKVRLALQLGTDKESLLKALGETQIIDTPLLEIDQENWVHQTSLKKANGALFDTQWKLPEEVKNISPSPETPAVTPAGARPAESPKPDEPTYINGPKGGLDFKTTEKKVTLTGTAPPNTKAIWVNDYELKKFTPGDKAWSYVASFDWGNLKKGENRYEIYAIDFQGVKTWLDRIIITQEDQVLLTRLEQEKLAEENQEAAPLPTRVNEKGERLILNLITTQNPSAYSEVAQMLKAQWQKLGVELDIEVLESEVFRQRLEARDYDLLLFGQNLGYNLDSYPYWHSSQAKEGGLNLSQFKNFAVDSLLEQARLQHDRLLRKKTLESIQNIMSTEVPAIFLYSPTYRFAQTTQIQNASFKNLATLSDRFTTIEDWYGRSKRRLREEVGFFTFFPWLMKQF